MDAGRREKSSSDHLVQNENHSCELTFAEEKAVRDRFLGGRFSAAFGESEPAKTTSFVSTAMQRNRRLELAVVNARCLDSDGQGGDRLHPSPVTRAA